MASMRKHQSGRRSKKESMKKFSGCSEGRRRRGRRPLLNAMALCWRQAACGGKRQTWSKANVLCWMQWSSWWRQGSWQAADVEQSQGRLRPGQLTFWLTYLGSLKQRHYTRRAARRPSKYCSSWTRCSSGWPSLRRNLADAAFVSIIKPYQMVWEGRSLLLCDAQHLQRSIWIAKRRM